MAKNRGCCAPKDPARLNKVGGQAVLEGVMMKAGERTVTTCRKEDGSLVVTDGRFVSVRKKNKLLNIPILRGVVNFIEMMALSFKTLSISADALGIEEEEKKAKEEKLRRKNEKRRKAGKAEIAPKEEKKGALIPVIMTIAMVLGVALALFLFMYLPRLSADGISYLFYSLWHLTVGPSWIALIEGLAKIVIFLLYLWLVSLIPDIKRTFMYHGAEHKSIACFESGAPLTPENAKNYTRFHPRCGTSFMFVMILLGIFAGMFVNNIFHFLPSIAQTGIRLAILPIVMGLGYEFIMLAGKHDNFLTRALSAPGLWVQRLTTKEPTADMLEVAIISIKCALRDDFPEFMEFYNNREWEAKCDEADNAQDEAVADEGVTAADESATVIEEAVAEEAVAEEAVAEEAVADTARDEEIGE